MPRSLSLRSALGPATLRGPVDTKLRSIPCDRSHSAPERWDTGSAYADILTLPLLILNGVSLDLARSEDDLSCVVLPTIVRLLLIAVLFLSNLQYLTLPLLFSLTHYVPLLVELSPPVPVCDRIRDVIYYLA